jgi:hypothetical protein
MKLKHLLAFVLLLNLTTGIFAKQVEIPDAERVAKFSLHYTEQIPGKCTLCGYQAL